MDAYVRVCTYSTYKRDFDLIGPCCSRERTGQAASEASRFGSWRSLCPSRDGRRGRCTPSLGTTAGDKSEERREDGGRSSHTNARGWEFEKRQLQTHPHSTHLANVVWADGGDGLEGQLLAAHTHEDLLHLAEEILYTYTDRRRRGNRKVGKTDIYIYITNVETTFKKSSLQFTPLEICWWFYHFNSSKITSCQTKTITD